jgi:hypothetical protein
MQDRPFANGLRRDVREKCGRRSAKTTHQETGERPVSLISTSDDDVVADDLRLQELRRRIGWICQILRFGAPVTFIWGQVDLMIYLADKARLSKQAALILDESFMRPFTDWQCLALFAISIPSTLADFALVYNVWLLVSGYLAGRIFTIDAARLMQRCGVAGIASVIASLLMRAPALAIYAASRPTRGPFADPFKDPEFYFGPGDLHMLMFYLALIALAHVQKTAAEICSENGQIV